ncbi:retrovirus-related pol polyprotein from transposon TNT 1-94 [Tanacetum coccineum]|uniref:Retrovirus-related pol polyprotein from transposon TNT 1-94 n=1 Tax=Tanacetum coccineum TaxID=301880 RepID=A0ABQ4Y4P5_9ASTR
MEFESAQSNTTAKLPILKLGNEATKKTQKTLLKQQYENFSASSTEALDSIFNRLQKIVSRLAILADIETMSIDDLYKNFKIVEQDVKKYVGASSGAQNLAFMTAPSTSSINDVNTDSLAYEVSTVCPNINTACPQVSTANFSDNTVYAFMVENPNGSNLLQHDLEQIHEDDLEAMDLMWQLSLLSMRAKRECRAPRIEEGQFRNQDNTRKQGNNEDTSSKAMLAIDGVATTYKRGLATLEEQLITYRKNEVLFSEEVAVLKREVACKDYEINVLKSEFEKVKQEKEGIKFKIEKFDNASKRIDKLLGGQITEKSKKGLGYNDVPPPHPLIYNRPKKLDLSYSNDSKENSDDSLVKKQISKDTSSFVESSLNVDKETVFLVDKKLEFSKSKKHEKLVKKSVRSFDHVQAHCKYHQRERMVYGNNYNMVNYNYTTNRTHPNAQRNMVPRAVLMKTGLKSFNTARTVHTAHPKSIVYSAKLMPKAVKTARPNSVVVNDVRVNQENAVKTSACWVWRPTKPDSASITLKKHNYIDARGRSNGCSRHITGNIAYLSDFKEFDGGYVTFGGGAHDGRISGKGTPTTNSLDFEDNLTYLVAKATSNESMLWHRTPQQNGVAKRRNKTLIKAARTMLADSKLPTTFWAEVVSTACYVQNRVLVVKPHNKTPYELFRGFKPALSFMRPFGCHVTILNTLDSLGKFDGKSDEGFFVGYSLSSKAFRVYNTRTRRVEENLHIGFLENKPMIEGNGPKWLFDIDSLTQSMNYVPVARGTISNESAGSKEEFNAGTSTQKEEISQDCIVMPIWKDASYFDLPSKDVGNDEPKSATDDQNPEVNTGRFKLNIVDPSVNTAIWKPVDLPNGKRAIGTKWVFRNKKDERGIVIRNKARLVTQGHRQEEGIDYEEVFAPMARIKAIILFLAYASFMGFLVYQMDVKSAILYGTIEEEVYVTQPPIFKDPGHPDKVYKVTQKEDGIFISQDKYVAEILKKFNYTDVKFASTPIDLEKPLVKDGDADDVNIHLYRSLIGSLMYHIASRQDIMFAVCTCARFQVTPKTSHLLAIKRNFRYLKGKPTLGLWYSRDSPFELVTYTDSDYAGATQDRKSTTRDCQLLENGLISW